MKTGTFEVMEQNEMMAVNGGARRKSARQAAVNPIAVPATVAACIGLGANTAGFLCAY